MCGVSIDCVKNLPCPVHDLVWLLLSDTCDRRRELLVAIIALCGDHKTFRVLDSLRFTGVFSTCGGCSDISVGSGRLSLKLGGEYYTRPWEYPKPYDLPVNAHTHRVRFASSSSFDIDEQNVHVYLYRLNYRPCVCDQHTAKSRTAK